MDRVVDREELLAQFDDDLAFLGDAMELFREESPGLLEQIGCAIRDGDAEALHRAAHSYKGMIANFCAPAVIEAALALQLMGAEARLEGAEAASAALSDLVVRFESEIAEVLG